MPITAGIVNAFKVEVLKGTHKLMSGGSGGDSLKLALYPAAATIGPTTATYTATGELADGNGYTTGGPAVAVIDPTLDSTAAVLDFADISMPSCTFTVRGGYLYNTTRSNRGIAVFDFGADISVTNGTFEIIWPTAAAATAAIRLT